MEFTEELGLMKNRVARRKMEAQAGGGGGGEVRRIHIIYFLSRKGRIEHPHLIRLHHLSRNGVRLRDVKRWLSELRGKDMPESFAWSYKRRYKTGFVWQDLLDEDLITPISDNEYVLKGSEIPSSNLDLHSHGEKKVSIQKKPTHETNARDYKLPCKEEIQEHPETIMDILTKPSSEIEEQSPPFGSEASTLTDDSMKLEEEKNSDTKKQETPKQSDKFENSPSFYSTLLNRKNSKKNKNKNMNNNVESPSTPASSTSSYSFTKSKSYSSGASNMFRSFLSCGAVDTNDAAMVMINRHDMSSNGYLPPINKPDDDNASDNTAKIWKGEKLGGSLRIFGTPWNQQQSLPNARKSYDGVKNSNKNKSEFNNQKPVPAAYKPVNGPNCSQCGKMFTPEKMHAHMKSCRGMKSSVRGTAAAAAAASEPKRSMDSSYQESVSSYFLTN